jgi:hypothetical protein
MFVPAKSGSGSLHEVVPGTVVFSGAQGLKFWHNFLVSWSLLPLVAAAPFPLTLLSFHWVIGSHHQGELLVYLGFVLLLPYSFYHNPPCVGGCSHHQGVSAWDMVLDLRCVSYCISFPFCNDVHKWRNQRWHIFGQWCNEWRTCHLCALYTTIIFIYIYCLMIFLSCVLDFCAWSVQPLESLQSMLLKSIVCLYLVFKYEWNRMAMIFMLTVIC